MVLAVLSALGIAWGPRASQAAERSGLIGPLGPDSASATYEDVLAALTELKWTSVPGDRAWGEWRRLMKSGDGWPLVVGDDDDLASLAEVIAVAGDVDRLTGASAPSIEAMLATARGLNFPEDLRKWDGAFAEEELTAPLGNWPPAGQMGSMGLSVSADFQGRPKARVHLLRLPLSEGLEVPAFLRWGDWNACPPPEYHVAALRTWEQRYGATLVGMTGDTMDLFVTRKPSSRDEALALAREQYLYCPDLVDQGTLTVSGLAAMLMESDWWSFWWD